MARILALALVLPTLLVAQTVCQEVTIWFGNHDNSPLVFRIGAVEKVPVWIMTQSDVYIAAVHIPLSSNDELIKERLGGTLYAPFEADDRSIGLDRGWDAVEIKKPAADQKREGFTSQGILGFCDLAGKPNVRLHCEEPCLVAEFEVRTSDGDSLRGRFFDAFVEGYELPSGKMDFSDTLGIHSYTFEACFGEVYFLFPGDINGDRRLDAIDVENLRLFLDGLYSMPWPGQQGDINDDGKTDEEDLALLRKAAFRE